MISRTKLNRYATVIILILISFVIILTLCNNTINNVKDAKEAQIVDVRKRDFEVVWGILEALQQQANANTEALASTIETQIKENFDLDELKEKLDANDPAYTKELYQLFSNAVKDVHFGKVNNNRNAIIVLEGYDTIVEDLFVDPDSRADGIEVDDTSNTLSKYRDSTYNKAMFDTAIRKIRNHTDSSLIVMEPYNYINPDLPHEKLREADYASLERVYVNEGFNGLRNYQFMVPVYITDTGDIFGQSDIVQGIHQDTHKFIIIQTFNLYDQIMSTKSDFGDDDYLGRLNSRYDRILNSLYILGIVVCALIALIIIYFLSIYNALITKDSQVIKILSDINKEKDIKSDDT